MTKRTILILLTLLLSAIGCSSTPTPTPTPTPSATVQITKKASVPSHTKKASVSSHTKKASVSRHIKKASVSSHTKKASVSSHKKKASVSTRKHKVAKSSSINNGMFNRVYRNWKGTPYRYGGSSKKGIDCSAFVQVGYSSVYKKALPRTTLQLVKKGKKVNRNNAKEGDLVFFRTGRNSRHVGIYLGNLKFMHASQSKGVIISRLDNPYWRRHFWQIRRLDKS